MANPEHLEILKQGVKVWNLWRRKLPTIIPDLSYAQLSGADLRRVDLSKANLQNINLSGADLHSAKLGGADLSGANLRDANIRETDLRMANLSRAQVDGADFEKSHVFFTLLGYMDLSNAKGLDTVKGYPSSIGIDTLYLSKGKIPEAFLRTCGVPEDFILFLPALKLGNE